MLRSTASLVATEMPRPYRRWNPRAIDVRVPGGSHAVRFRRTSPVFTYDESGLAMAYAEALQLFSEVPRAFATTASEDILTKAIANRCATSPIETRRIEIILQTVVRHSSITYEGSRVSVNVCVDLGLTNEGPSLQFFLERPWAPILGSGISTALLVGRDGKVESVLELPRTGSRDILAPEPFVRVAAWTATPGRVALSISRSGDIFLFIEGQLPLARRSSKWRAFPIDALLRSGWFGSSNRKIPLQTKRAVLASLIDASAAHHGACLGILPNGFRMDDLSGLISERDQWASTSNDRRRMFGSSKILELSRRQRLELLSMDGATIIDHGGNILCGGAILQVPGGSPGGGRTAAARAIARHGLGVKVSQDGPVTALMHERGRFRPQFSLG